MWWIFIKFRIVALYVCWIYVALFSSLTVSHTVIMFLIISPNIISILLGWDGLDLVSYLLVIYYQNMRSCGAGMLTVPSWSCSQAVSKPVWHIPLLCVQWKIPDDGQRNCPKHVEFHSKNKFEKLMHLVGFIIQYKLITMHGHVNVKFSENMCHYRRINLLCRNEERHVDK
jgi:hypothetical protein